MVDHSQVLLPLLVDPDEEVRQGAECAITGAGPGIMPVLRNARHVTVGRLRTRVLEMLAKTVGFDGLDPRDQAVIRRLVAVKSLREAPEPIEVFDGSWYAVPTNAQEAVLEAFDLSDPRPVTMRLGESAWHHGVHNTFNQEHHRCRWMYITPVFDGWTLAFGVTPDGAHRGTYRHESPFPDVIEHCRKLSLRFGEAHWYAVDVYGWHAWFLARDGEIVRYYDASGTKIGDRLPEERLFRTGEEPLPAEARVLLEALDWDDEAAVDALEAKLETEFGLQPCLSVPALAGEMSLNPETLGPHTLVQGHAVLAASRCGRRYGVPIGALNI